MNDNAELVERLAAIEHEQWSGWMRYMFNKCEFVAVGALLIPSWAVNRWTRQMETPYADLPESEKESDRVEAQRVLAALCVREPEAAIEIQRLSALVDDARRERDEWRDRMHEVYDLVSRWFDDPRVAELQKLLIEAYGVVQFGGRTKSANDNTNSFDAL